MWLIYQITSSSIVNHTSIFFLIYIWPMPCQRIQSMVSVKHRSPSMALTLKELGILNYNFTLQWRHNERDGVSNHWRLDCLLRRGSKTTPKLNVTGFWEGNSPVSGDFPAQRASNAENVSIWRHHHSLRMFSLQREHFWMKLIQYKAYSFSNVDIDDMMLGRSYSAEDALICSQLLMGQHLLDVNNLKNEKNNWHLADNALVCISLKYKWCI